MEGLSVIHRRIIEGVGAQSAPYSELQDSKTPNSKTPRLSLRHLFREHQLSRFFLGVDASPQVRR